MSYMLASLYRKALINFYTLVSEKDLEGWCRTSSDRKSLRREREREREFERV